jgi:P-type Mg2+ transporter
MRLSNTTTENVERADIKTLSSLQKYPGLTSREASARLLKYGENSIFRKKRMRPLISFVKKFNSPLLLLLIGTSFLTFFLGEKTNAIIILTMVMLSGIMDFLNTYKSELVAEKLLAKVTTTATVLRDGERREIEFKNIVPGDVIFLSAGDVIPADGFVIEADDFFVNQSALTGESFPAEKIPGKDSGDSSGSPAESHSAIFMGTSVVTGFATAVVEKAGSQAEFGKIAERLAAEEPETDFEKGIKKFSYFVMRLTFVMVAFVFFANAFFGRGMLESFLFAIAIAVGVTPELLPVIMSVSLSHGSVKMSKLGVVVKNLSSVQNFGSMNVFCTDKTGTLTEDKIVLMKCIDFAGNESEEVFLHAYLDSSFHTARQSPLDAAIQNHRKMDLAEWEKIDEIPFDFERKRESVVAEKAGARHLITKGAPEDMIAICDFMRESDKISAFGEKERYAALERFEKLSSDGFRVLAIAVKDMDGDTRVVYDRADEAGMTFLGFAAFLDPPKKTAGEAVQDLHALNVEIKILTGDNELLAERICREIGLQVKGVLTGADMAGLTEKELEIRAAKTTLFARVNPGDKERIISALRRAGNVVGYLGDGINDAPALKAADVGISVNNAVDVAKETADLILLTKSLHVLKDGIEEGRKTFQNTMKYIKMGLSSNFGNMFSMMGASAFLPFLPMLPSQILLNNFLYDMSQTTLPSDATDDEDIKRPLKWNLAHLQKYMGVFGLVSSVFDFLTFFALWWFFKLSESQFQTGWFIESIATQVFVVYVIRTKRIPFLQSKPSKWLALSTALVVVIAWVIPLLPIGHLFGFTRLPGYILVCTAAIVFIYLIVAESIKRLFYAKFPET